MPTEACNYVDSAAAAGPQTYARDSASPATVDEDVPRPDDSVNVQHAVGGLRINAPESVQRLASNLNWRSTPDRSRSSSLHSSHDSPAKEVADLGCVDLLGSSKRLGREVRALDRIRHHQVDLTTDDLLQFVFEGEIPTQNNLSVPELRST